MFLVFRNFTEFFDDLGEYLFWNCEYLFYSGSVPVLCLGDCTFIMHRCMYIWWCCIIVGD